MLKLKKFTETIACSVQSIARLLNRSIFKITLILKKSQVNKAEYKAEKDSSVSLASREKGLGRFFMTAGGTEGRGGLIYN